MITQNTNLNFMKYKYLYFMTSLLFIIPSIFSLLVWGLKPSIDFTGGSILELRVKNDELKINNQKIEEIVNQETNLSSIQQTQDNTYILKTKEINQEQKEKIIQGLKNQAGDLEELRFETVGPIIGKELIKKTIYAVLIASGFILLYVARAFKEKKYGICAVLAMFHDSLILLGIFSLLGHFYGVEIDTLFVTAMLTILSFSVHDTVVVYDRIRESLKNFPTTNFEDLANKAVAETLTRSLNNSLTIIFMLLCLYLLGGETIKWFSLALLMGTIFGTYSSTFTAVPLLVVWDKLSKKRS